VEETACVGRRGTSLRFSAWSGIRQGSFDGMKQVQNGSLEATIGEISARHRRWVERRTDFGDGSRERSEQWFWDFHV
jgi:hypothetical protein